jgi:nitroreductase
LLKKNHINGDKQMDTFEAIHTRRSIRQFTGGEVSEDQVQKILSAAMCAPSAGNAHPWHFLVLRERAILDRIPEIHPHALMTKQASLGILVCGDLQLEKYQGFWVEDCAAATQNLLLAAHALGLGAVWTGIYPDAERTATFQTEFTLPETIIPFAFIPMGPPAQILSRKDIYLPERVHVNGWNS